MKFHEISMKFHRVWNGQWNFIDNARSMFFWCILLWTTSVSMDHQLCLLLIIFDDSNFYYFLTSRICSQQPPFLHIFKAHVKFNYYNSIAGYIHKTFQWNFIEISMKFHWNLWNFIARIEMDEISVPYPQRLSVF